MNDIVLVDCFGAKLEVYDFLADLWPHNLPLKKWPSFCGAGCGIGDLIVPDTLFFGHLHLAPACYMHDVEWILCDPTIKAFHAANDRLRRNLKALADAQLCSPWNGIAKALIANEYHFAVDTVGWLHFKTMEFDKVNTPDPLDNPSVRDKIHRLARVAYGINGYDRDGGAIR